MLFGYIEKKLHNVTGIFVRGNFSTYQAYNHTTKPTKVEPVGPRLADN